MIALSLAEVADIVGGAAPDGAADVMVTSVEFDTRTVHPGALFVALPGEHVDGHDYGEAAARAGAVAAIGIRPVAPLPTIVLTDPGLAPIGDFHPAAAPVLAALARLAHEVAARLADAGLTIVGVTGSAGKTSTKDLIRAVLSQVGTVVAPPESFNNELGFPYTVLRADESTRFLVLELSARGIGHIAALTTIARPRIGAVLNVGSAHLGEFGSRDAIAVAKGELVESLPAADQGGVAVLNADDPRVDGMAARTAAAIVRTGTGADADVRAEGVTVDDAARASFTLVTPEGSAPVHLAVVGGHQVANALAAAAVARAAGMDVATVAAALGAAGPTSRWRMEITDVPGGVTVINDAYNANPESMRAALAALERMAAPGTRWAALGQMAELGAAADEAHRELGAAAARAGITVVAVGEEARAIWQGARDAIVDDAPARPEPLWFDGVDTAAAALATLLRPGDAVLVKASRAAGLERLAARLTEALPSVLADQDGPGRQNEERA